MCWNLRQRRPSPNCPQGPSPHPVLKIHHLRSSADRHHSQATLARSIRGPIARRNERPGSWEAFYRTPPSQVLRPLLIMYISGPTGASKGVLVTHPMIASVIASVQHLLGHHFQLDYDIFIAFLPLAHSFECAVELALCSLGVLLLTVVFWSVMHHRDDNLTTKTPPWVEPSVTTVFHLPRRYQTRHVNSPEARDLTRGQL